LFVIVIVFFLKYPPFDDDGSMFWISLIGLRSHNENCGSASGPENKMFRKLQALSKAS
jgi:hypothetical protein